MNRIILACILSAAAGLAHGATLAPRALLCDFATDLQAIDQVLSPQDQRGRSGAELLAMVRGSAKAWAAMRNIGALQAQEGAQDGGTYGYPVREPTRPQQGQALIQEVDRKVAVRKAILSHCMTTEHEQSATVLKRRAVSGYVQIRTEVNGQAAKVWTKARFIVSP